VKLVFWGSPETGRIALEKLIREGHSLELVVTQPDRPAGRGKKLTISPVKSFALEQGLPVIQPRRVRKDPTVLERLEEIRPDLNVVVAYGQIMPTSVIYAPTFNTVNLHFSLLPYYRGAAPVQWTILRGETITGVTVFELDAKMDEGPILTQQEVTILPGENALDLERRLAGIGADLLAKTIADIRSLELKPQDHALATYAPLLKKEDGEIDWRQSSVEIDRLVRAFYPWPSTFTFLNEKRLKILKGRTDPSPPQAKSVPGQIVAVGKQGISICCGDSQGYLIQELQPENKKAMGAYAFAHGAQIHAGDRLASSQ
jgi:methionyl-tRNA formyltransferase